VLAQSARPGVVDRLRGRSEAERGPELGIVEQPEEKLADVPVADLAAESPDLREQIVGVESRVGLVPFPEGDDKSIHVRVL